MWRTDAASESQSEPAWVHQDISFLKHGIQLQYMQSYKVQGLTIINEKPSYAQNPNPNAKIDNPISLFFFLENGHHLLIPGTPSSTSPPECLFFTAGLTGELFTNVGPLLTGLGNAGVEILFDLPISL